MRIFLFPSGGAGMAEGELQLRGRHDEGTASGIAMVKSTGKPKAIGTMTASVNSDEGPFWPVDIVRRGCQQ